LVKNFLNSYIHKQRGKWFIFLLNSKAVLKKSDARFSYLKSRNLYSVGSIKPDDDRKLYFKHELQGGLTYIEGIFKRGEYMGEIYFLNEICFIKNDIVIDCGANLGDLYIWFQNRSHDINYKPFEPAPEEFKCLKENIRPHKANQVALFKENGIINFFVSSQNADSSLVQPKYFTHTIKANTRKLESYIDNTIKLLKLEAEGCELEVLIGAGQKIKKIQYISADLGPERGANNDSTFVSVKNYLISQNFEILKVNHQRHTVLFKNKSF